MSEHDIRDVLLEAGYTIETINDILTAKAMAGPNVLSNSTISFSTDSTRGSELTDQENHSMSDSVTENAFDTLKEI